MATSLYSGSSGIALGVGMARGVVGLYGGTSGLLSAFGFSAFGFSPLSLFAASEPGAWYDPSDLSTLYQDAAGTVPVTAAGQVVGRINDKSGRGNHATQATAASKPLLQQDATGRYYLLFDGTDDFLVTPTITPGIDKAQVFAGVRKLSDAAAGRIIELSDGFGSLGTFRLEASPTATAAYEFVTGGSLKASAKSATTFPAPVTNILTGLGEIATDLAILRINGNQVAQSNWDQGSNIFQPYPLCIGARADKTLPFNGRLYGLITRFGANLSDAQIAQAESWLNQRTGAY